MATQKIYQNFLTQSVFKNTDGNVTMTMKNIANGAGRISNQLDRGAGALPGWFKWEAVMTAAANVTIGNPWRLYIYSAQTSSSNVDTTTDTALTAETQLLNFQPLGSVKASANTTGPFYNTGYIWIPGRYVNLGWWNASGQTTANTDGTTVITITSIYDEIQAPA